MMATLRVSIEDVEELKTLTCSEAHQEAIHVHLDLKEDIHFVSHYTRITFCILKHRFEISALRFD